VLPRYGLVMRPNMRIYFSCAFNAFRGRIVFKGCSYLLRKCVSKQCMSMTFFSSANADDEMNTSFVLCYCSQSCHLFCINYHAASVNVHVD